MDQQYQQQNSIQNAQISSNNSAPITVGQWLITFLLMAIPIVNIILLFIWAFDSDTNPNKKNFAKAYLIIMAIGFVLAILIGILAFVLSASIFSSLSNYGIILF
jgi:heme/copper-type cytochrome/quinol oxidase subunit 4